MFSLLSQSFKFIRKAAALMLLPLLASSCTMIMDDDYDDEIIDSNAPQYINITVSVSTSSSAATRAPMGGEYGDGTEESIGDRENKINEITLIFYQDETGINTSSNDAEVACVKKYSVRPFDKTNDLPNSHTHKTGNPAESSTAIDQEVLYTTGNQRLDETDLKLGESYNVLVVANAVVDVKPHDKIKNVRDKVLSTVYTGTGIGIDATDFVMTSETDATMTLVNPSIETSNGENKMVFYFDCIHIERLAARIDYCTGDALYDDDLGGYKYSVGSAGAFFVVTKVMPFNLYNENEYLFKRVQDAWPATTTTYLGDESTTNFVVDPKTANKDNGDTEQPVYLNPLTADMNNSYTQVMSAVHETSAITDVHGNNNIIIAYPIENTLQPNSRLKRYATGIAFEIKYYANATATAETRYYYYYLRHQGENTDASPYKAKLLTSNNVANDTQECGNLPMNYGIVRNNIYRVEISGLSDVLDLRIKVKKWDKFTHDIIYM